MELFCAGSGGSPLEEHDRPRPARHRLQAPQPHLPRLLEHVARSPVDLRRDLLHQHPGLAIAQGTGDVILRRRDARCARLRGVGIRVQRHDILLCRPGAIVERLEKAHKVGGHGHVRRDAAQDLALHVVEFEQAVGRKAPPVQLLRGVGKGGGAPWRVDLVPVVIALAPEGRAPGLVERIQRTVAPLQPGAKCGRRVIAEAFGDVAAVLIVDVPDRQRRVMAIAFRQARDQFAGRMTPGVRVRAVGLAPSRPQGDAIGGLRQALRVAPGQPGRGRGGGRRQASLDAVRLQQVEHAVQPAKLIVAGARLQVRPGKDAYRHQVDACGLHQAHVLQPDFFRPLFRVVVAAIPDTGVVQK